MNLRPVFVLYLAEALSMAGFSTYPAVLPMLRSAWGMTNTEAGLVGARSLAATCWPFRSLSA